MRYEALNSLPEAELQAAVSRESTVSWKTGKGNDLYTITLTNDSFTPAVQTRIRTVSSVTGADILPTFYRDNYFALMPGESKTVTVEFDPKYLESGRPVFRLSGWNTRMETIE
jgi:hypothetical protein